MDKDTLLEAFGQVNITQAASLFGEFVRVAVAELACNVMAAEATKLCGACYHPDKSSDAFRAGSAPGTILFEGERLAVKRPRVRKRKDNGASVEMQLLSYAAATDPGKVEEMFMRALRGGVSTRDQKQVFPHSPAASKSSISRMWAARGRSPFRRVSCA